MADHAAREAAIKEATHAVRSGHPARADEGSKVKPTPDRVRRLEIALVTISMADDPDAPISRQTCALVARQALEASRSAR